LEDDSRDATGLSSLASIGGSALFFNLGDDCESRRLEGLAQSKE